MAILFDLLPILLFFIAFKLWGIYVATGVAIGATAIQLIIAKLSTGSIRRGQWLSFAAIFILGGATLLLKNEMFIKWKPTIVYGIFGVVTLVSSFFGKKPLLQHLGDVEKDTLNLPAHVWRKLNTQWGVFFIFMGLTNLYVAYNFDTNTWTNFKLFGVLGGTFMFVVIQALFISRWSKF